MVVIFGSTDFGNADKDYDGSYALSDGTLLCVEVVAIDQVPTNVSQYTLSYTVSSSKLLSETTLCITDSNDYQCAFTLPKNYSTSVNSIISSSSIKKEVNIL